LVRFSRRDFLQPGGNDERRGQGENVRGNIAAIQRIAAQHGTKVIVLDRLDHIASDARLPDGQHFSAAGHAKFAPYLVPKVRAAGACAK
jgi:hypothetical protein